MKLTGMFNGKVVVKDDDKEKTDDKPKEEVKKPVRKNTVVRRKTKEVKQ